MKRYIQPAICLMLACGLIFFLVSLLRDNQTQFTEEKLVAESGWLYKGQSTISIAEFNQVKTDLKTSQLYPSLTVLFVSDDIVDVKYNFYSATDYPNLIKAETHPAELAFHQSLTPILIMVLAVVGGMYYLSIAKVGKKKQAPFNNKIYKQDTLN